MDSVIQKQMNLCFISLIFDVTAMIVWFGLDFMWFVVNFDFKRFPQRHWFEAVRLLHILLATTDLKKKSHYMNWLELSQLL